MFKKFNIAVAIATAAIASTALATPASATPDPVTLNSAGNTFQFGNACAPGQPPFLDGVLVWRTIGNTGAPLLNGTLCLQNTMSQARLRVIYHDAAFNVIDSFVTAPVTGLGNPLDAFAVIDGGPRRSYAVLDHVHVQIQSNAGAGWVIEANSPSIFP